MPRVQPVPWHRIGAFGYPTKAGFGVYATDVGQGYHAGDGSWRRTVLNLNRRTATLKTFLDAMPGVTATPLAASRTATPGVLLYKVRGKMFAILSIRGTENVILKCDPQLAEILREQYAGIGHRSHLDRRTWISVNLDADVPAKEIRRLCTGSYDIICAKLTRKQKAELAALSS